MKRIFVHVASVAAGIAVALSLSDGPARAQEPFAGKTITIIAGYPPGGGVDGEMRLTAKHIGRFIPGNPNVVPRNMPGAGGATSGNFIYRAEPDGLTLGMPARSGFMFSNIIKQDGIAYDLTKFSFIGSAGGTNSILWMRKQAGIKTVDDLRNAKKELVIAGVAARSGNVLVPKVLAKYEKWPFRVVHGYPGFTEVLIAVERGEADGLYTHEGSVTRADMINSGALIAVLQTFPDMKGVPLLSDIVTNPDEKALLGLLNAPSRVGLPLLGPPGIAKDRLETLRKSFAAMAADKDYRNEGEKRGFPVGSPVSGEELEKIVLENLAKVPDSVLAEYKSYMEN